MSRSRDYVADLPAEFVEKLKRKGKHVLSLDQLCEEFVEFTKKEGENYAK